MKQAEDIIIRPMQPGEEGIIQDLIMDGFHRFIAPGYSQEGIDTFSQYVRAGCILQRASEGHIMLVAADDDTIAGIMEIRAFGHISLFFVREQYQRRGLARRLLHAALDLCYAHDPAPIELTVNASPYAVKIYEKLGFRPLEDEKVKDGIRFTPMVLDLT